jgi:hypothetical protein
MPQGGMEELQRILLQEKPTILQLIQHSKNHPDARALTKLHGYIIAVMYCFTPQGRPKAVDFLSKSDGLELASGHVVLSSKFKTVSTYG